MLGFWWSFVAAQVAFGSLSVRSKRQQQPKRDARGCMESELLQLSLFLATGPLFFGSQQAITKCIPSQNQSLPAPWSVSNLENDVSAEQASHFGSHLAISIKNSSEIHSNGKRSKNNKPFFVHLLVVQSNQDWCEAPCMSPSWELASPKPKTEDGLYALFETAIWRQERRVALYRFDKAWERRARSSYHSLCMGKSWSCPAYRGWRESRALLSVGPWPSKLDRDGKKLSAWLGDAFIKIFAKIKEEEPSAEHFGMSYNGHGSTADGSLFEGSLNVDDAAEVLRSAVGKEPFGTRFGLLNFGGNCNEGKWNMLASLHWAAHWITASDLKVGGVNTSSSNQVQRQAMTEATQRLNDAAVLMRSVEDQKSLEEIVKDLAQARKQLWAEGWKPFIEKQNLRQSISGYKTDEFPAFAKALYKDYNDASLEKQKKFVKVIEKADCDVLTGARVLNPSLEDRFRKVVPIYESTEDMISSEPWTTHGLGFNFLGWKGPPCDLHLPVGAEKVEAEWSAGYSSMSEEDFEQQYSFRLSKKHMISRH